MIARFAVSGLIFIVGALSSPVRAEVQPESLNSTEILHILRWAGWWDFEVRGFFLSRSKASREIVVKVCDSAFGPDQVLLNLGRSAILDVRRNDGHLVAESMTLGDCSVKKDDRLTWHWPVSEVLASPAHDGCFDEPYIEALHGRIAEYLRKNDGREISASELTLSGISRRDRKLFFIMGAGGEVGTAYFSGRDVRSLELDYAEIGGYAAPAFLEKRDRRVRAGMKGAGSGCMP